MNDGVAGLRLRHRYGGPMRARDAARQWTAVVVRVVLGVLGMMTGTMRHRHSRAGRINGSVRPNCASNLGPSWLIFRQRNRAHDPEKCAAVFRKDHAPTIT